MLTVLNLSARDGRFGERDQGNLINPLSRKAPAIFSKSVCQLGAGHLVSDYTRLIAEHRNPAIDFENIIYTRSVDESKALNDYHEPMIIISASGMAESGRIQHHLANNIEDGRNTIVIISWQAPDTLGRRLADQERKVRIFGEEYYRKAEVVTIGGLSAHAGQDLLVEYALASKETLKKIIFVHGEEKAYSALRGRLDEHDGLPEIAYPQKGEVFAL